MPLLTTLFWGSAAWLTFTYLGYPLVLGVAARLRPRPWQTGPELPGLTLLIAAWNEEGVLEAKLENALQLDYPAEKLQILVASDGSTDQTEAIARRFASRGVTLLALPRGGKTATLNRALETVQSELVVFSDANVFFEPDALRRLVRHFADPSIGGVSGDVRLRPEGFTLGESQGLYYRLERHIQRLESLLGSMIGADGGMYALRRSLCQPLPSQLINDDFLLSMGVVRQGYRLVYDPEAVGYEDSPVDAANEFRRKIRVEQGNFQALWSGLAHPPVEQPVELFCFLGHKVSRWLGFVPLSVALGTSLILSPLGGMYRLAASSQLLFYGLAWLGGRLEGKGGPLLQVPFYFALENVAAVRGLGRMLTGRTSWGTARTRTRQA